MKRIISLILSIAMMMTMFPAAVFAEAETGDSETLMVDNKYIGITVNKKNGGFYIKTIEGNVLKKSDNNAALLYRSDEFDTSFTTFRVKEASSVAKDYIFGNKYGFLGINSSDVASTKDENGITSVWSVGDIKVTQRLTLENITDGETSGTVQISYKVENTGTKPVDVDMRALLDTMLDNKDSALYELKKPGQGQGYRQIEQETKVTGEDVPASFFAYNDSFEPTVAAYSINEKLPDVKKPYQITFAHWNNIAATVFDYTPPADGIHFTNEYNSYKTADSAQALYFHMETIAPGESKQLSTYYGVTSNFDTLPTDRLVINTVSPTRIELDTSKLDQNGNQNGEYQNNGMFKVSTAIENTMDNAINWSKTAVAIYGDNGMQPYDALGGSNYTNERPYSQSIVDFAKGETKTIEWNVKAAPQKRTSFKKLIFKVYDMSKSDNGLFLEENVLAKSELSILVPASVSGLAPIQFTGSTPDIIYNSGKRYINMTGYGFDIFKSKIGGWELKAISKMDPGKVYKVDPGNIDITDDEHMIITLMDNMELGDYEFAFEWTISDADLAVMGIDKVIKASGLKFVISDEAKYKCLSYGIITVEREAAKNNYHINNFADERAMANYYDANPEIIKKERLLLTLKGDFSKPFNTATTGVPDKIYNASGKTTAVTINGVLDFRGDNISIQEKDGSVNVKINGQLLTTGSSTSVWSGLSEINMNSGKLYKLVQYNQDGAVISSEPDPLVGESLLNLEWADNYGFLQTIGGFAINLRFGVFGHTVKTSGDDILTVYGNTVSFGGSIDLSFMTPGGAEKAKIQANPPVVSSTSIYYGPIDESEVVKPTVSLSVDDVLFGQHDNTVGFMGVRAAGEVNMPTIVKAMPGKAAGKIDINTIGKYEVGVKGAMEWTTFNMGFELRVKQAEGSGAPVPDKLLFTIGGFEPGINIDTLGGIWVTGGGGGIDKLYDTIYSKGGLPPLTIILQIQFDIVKALSSTAELELSARSFSLSLEDVTIKYTPLEILKGGNVAFSWYPGFSLNIRASMQFISIINGSVNLSANEKMFMFLVSAAISLPEEIPVVGGMEVASAELGGNMEKIWGQLKVLFLSLGITYYWGDGGVVFGGSTGGFGDFSKNTSQMKLNTPIAVGYDKETDKTLYMVVGNNLERKAISGTDRSLTQEEIDSFKTGTGNNIKRMSKISALGTISSISSNQNMSTHMIDLGSTSGDYLISIEGLTGELPLDIADRMVITDPNGNPYAVDYYAAGKDASTVTGNIILNKSKDKVKGLYISIPQKDYKAGKWLLQAEEPVMVTVSMALPMPELTSATASVNTAANTLNVAWDGTKLDDSLKVQIFLAADKDAPGIGIGSIYNANVQNVQIAIPDSITTGNYYVRVVMQKENSSFQSLYANNDSLLSCTNPNAPAKPTAAAMAGAGNGMAQITAASGNDIDGYIVNVLQKLPDETWTATAQTGIMFGKDKDGKFEDMLVGGSYSTLDEAGNPYTKGGLEPNNTYVALVSTYKNDSEGKPRYFSEALKTNELAIPAYTAPVIKMLPVSNDVKEDMGVFIFKTNDVKLKLTSNTDITGTLIIDSTVMGDKYSNPGKEFTFEQTLSEGEHIVEFSGSEAVDKDSFIHTQKIIVDTAPPRLIMQNPVNGSLYTEGNVNINAIVDKDSLFTIKVDDKILVDKQNLNQFIDQDSNLSYSLKVGNDKLSKIIEITAIDNAENKSVFTAELSNGDLGKIRRIYIAQNNEPVGGKGIVLDKNTKEAKLDVIGVTKAGQKIVLTNHENVKWSKGGNIDNINIDSQGKLVVSGTDNTFVEAAFELSNGFAYTDSVAVKYSAEVTPPDQGGDTDGDGSDHNNGGSGNNNTTKPAINDGNTGELKSILIKEKPGIEGVTNINNLVPYFLENGKEIIVKHSAMIGDLMHFRGSEGRKYQYKENGKIFRDIAGHWAESDIQFVTARELFGGTGIEQFSPNAYMTRGMVVTVFGRLVDANPEGIKASSFTDVKADSYYAAFVEWAAKAGLVYGIGNNKFAPDKAITREELSVIIANFAAFMDVDLTMESKNSPAFDDESKISLWAKDNIYKMQRSGIIKGKTGNKFDPKGIATRAEVAAILVRLIKSILK